MAKPTILPEWASSDLIDGVNGLPNKTEPTPEFKSSGLNRSENLTRQHVNYQFNLINDWVSFVNDNLQDGANYIRTLITTSDSAWIPNPSTKTIKFTVVGAGAGGGSVDGQGSNTAGCSAGGGSGASCILATNTIDDSYNITVGLGGPKGDGPGANNGTAGGASSVVGTPSIVVNMVANGGLPGAGLVSNSGSLLAPADIQATSSGGDINLIGGIAGMGTTVNGEVASVSRGGQSYLGSGPEPEGSGNGRGGSPTYPFGTGGSGAFSINSSSDFPAGDGADGIVIIEEYL